MSVRFRLPAPIILQFTIKISRLYAIVSHVEWCVGHFHHSIPSSALVALRASFPRCTLFEWTSDVCAWVVPVDAHDLVLGAAFLRQKVASIEPAAIDGGATVRLTRLPGAAMKRPGGGNVRFSRSSAR
ncbi:hypothetical protein GCM10010961_22810 [Pseudodonghicola xiamenensis]|uniref:Uncharacterized protein n=1 Tax=Pseudodonghicola xiamenensis TaxID=337702 RepID=A0A8J3MEZ5_9RHOB|nr:hypothetical protein GCM10010961_22810 [Pseudodonghicola xiamenensis]